jgi:peptide/nickel transport system permease protein
MISLMNPMDRAKALFQVVPSDFNRPRDYEGLIQKFGLDDPVHIQYWNWMVGTYDTYTGEIKGGILRGNLGWSQIGRSPVAEVIVKRLPATTELVLWSILPMIGVGVWMGIRAALNHNKFVDQLLRISAITGWSIPAFVFGLFVMYYFSSKLHIFPPGRLSLEFSDLVISDEFINYTNMNTIDAILNLRFDLFFNALSHLVLPIFTLTIANWAFLLRVTRFSMLETLQQEYLTFARSKGIPEPLIVRRHALPNALIPVITVGGLILVGLINGVVVTETIFNYPGLGSFLAEAAISLDLVSVAGVTMFSSLILVFGNLIVDVLYVVVDPRIRLD